MYPPHLRPSFSPASLISRRHRLFCPRRLLTHYSAPISLCQGRDTVTRLLNTFYCFLFAPTLSFNSLCGDRHPVLSLMKLRVCSTGVGCHIQPAGSTTVRSASYRPSRPTPSSICHPIISAFIRCPLPSLVALHIRRVSTRCHHLHRPVISAAHLPCRRCSPLERVCVCLSSATNSILVKPLAFSQLSRYMSSCLARPPPSYLRHPRILPSFDLRHLRNMLYLQPYPPPIFQSHSSIFRSIYLSIHLSISSQYFLSIISLSFTLCLSLFLLNLLVSRPLTHLLTFYS